MDNCLFCKIISGEIKADVVYQNEDVFAFRDINPQAPVHVLIIPKKHISTTNDITPADTNLMGKLLVAARDIAEKEGIAQSGYRQVLNCNAHGGQEVFHIHLHLIGGRQMTWPPG
ncbi:MAG TPA: histidine triad nucleotide-binding protein [Thermodesulfobacteriaceae bacterium]|nr:histidine triad nucleotide-binding protein [Thermodesulfobacteriaceae bacterium]